MTSAPSFTSTVPAFGVPSQISTRAGYAAAAAVPAWAPALPIKDVVNNMLAPRHAEKIRIAFLSTAKTPFIFYSLKYHHPPSGGKCS